MIVFRSPKRQVRWKAPACPVDFLIEFGEIEAAIVDRLCPDWDELSPEIERLRALSQAAAHSVVTGSALPSAIFQNEPISTSIPEGYAYYGLDPRTYIEAADNFHMAACPQEVVCIGIRSIGTSLSALVGAALEQRGARVHGFTVRPHGHPFHRRIEIGPQLEQAWRSLSNAHFAVIDEGPGLSGSSLTAVAEKLSELGIPDVRISFFPSWIPDGREFVSERARARWPRHRKYCAEFVPKPGWVDVSAGAWRSIFYGNEAEYPEVQPQHEARKYLDGPDLLKFEGFGPYGQPRFERARALADAGFSPRAFELSAGFMRSEFIPGQPLAAECRDPHLIKTMAEYLAFRATEFRVDDGTPLDELNTMIEVNCGAKFTKLPGPTQPVITDGRMLPHEWIATERGYLKTDSVDHGDNHFYPGPTDIAWDLAGTIAEFRFNNSESRAFVDQYIAHSRDRHVADRLPFFRAAYSAFRKGYRKTYDH